MSIQENKKTVITNYPNGGLSISVNGIITYVKYNTGDQIWLELRDDQYVVVRVETHDGLIKEEKDFQQFPFGNQPIA